MVKAQKYVLTKAFDGFATDENITLQEEELPALKDGEVLFEATFLSVDPYTRLIPFPVGNVLIGHQVARVVESKNAAYKVDSQHVGNFGWRTHTVCKPGSEGLDITALPALGDLSPSLALGPVGMTGTTAYLSLIGEKFGALKEGETVMVTGAAGAVGSMVGQMAHIKNCTVIGCAGSDAKVEWLKEIGYTHAFNYKTCNLGDELKKAAPNGIDLFYDNVGGAMAGEIVNNHMAEFGRMMCIGSISAYNETPSGPYPFKTALLKRLTLKGFLIFDQSPEKIQEAQKSIISWIKEGKLTAREHVTTGFENMRQAFYGLFKGENIGKSVLEIEPDSCDERL